MHIMFFFYMPRLLVGRNPGSDAHRLLPFLVFTSLSLVFAPPPSLTS